MTVLPKTLHYTASHEWVRVEGDIATVGITEHAQDQLGELVFVELPSLTDIVAAGDEAAVVESVKTASDVYAPVSGEIIEINPLLEAAPNTVNTSPYEEGWLFRIKMNDPEELGRLLSAQDYAAQIQED